MTTLFERTETAKITRIAMGSAIPEWLLVAEPNAAGAPRGNFRFDVDVDVLELEAAFLVFPVLPLGVQSGCRVIDDTGTYNHFVYAPGKPVQIIHQINHILPLEYRPMVEQHRAAQQALGAPMSASTEQVKSRPGFRVGLPQIGLIIAIAGVVGWLITLVGVAIRGFHGVQ